MIIETLFDGIEEGDIFDEDELIINKSEREMITIRRESNADIIRIFYYDCGHEYQGMMELSNNGYDELYPSDKFYKKYKRELIKASMW